jgi:hypothetical protein
MKNLILAIGATVILTTASHAGEPWPEKICKTLAGYERFDIKMSDHQPYKLAIARSNVLHMLRNHCGDDIRAREAVDMKAAGVTGGGGGVGEVGGGGDHGCEVGPDGFCKMIEFDRKHSTHCTGMALGGGMTAIDCDD